MSVHTLTVNTDELKVALNALQRYLDYLGDRLDELGYRHGLDQNITDQSEDRELTWIRSQSHRAGILANSWLGLLEGERD